MSDVHGERAWGLAKASTRLCAGSVSFLWRGLGCLNRFFAASRGPFFYGCRVKQFEAVRVSGPLGFRDLGFRVWV